MTQLSDNFYLSEFLRSQTAERMGKAIVADQRVISNLNGLCAEVLQPIRNAIGMSMHITSGYRPIWLNKKIGGSRTSAHMCGDLTGFQEAAADFVVHPDENLLEVCKRILEADGEQHIPFDQLIYEGTWIHVGWRKRSPRGEVLTAKFSRNALGIKRTTYLQGLVA